VVRTEDKGSKVGEQNGPIRTIEPHALREINRDEIIEQLSKEKKSAQ
jgi:hypothetical protein